MKFGQRVATLRKELGLTQSDLSKCLGTGFDQTRLSKIENGSLKASASVIEKLSQAFSRSQRDLVHGTDREEYYLTRSLTATERAQETESRMKDEAESAKADAILVILLKESYKMVFDLFEAVYGGDYIAPQVSAEEGYVELRNQCIRLAVGVEKVEAGITQKLYFPDHIEQRSDMDMLMDEWKLGERALVKQSLTALFEVAYRHRVALDENALEEVRKLFKIAESAKAIAALHTERENIEAAWKHQVFGSASVGFAS